MKYLRYILPFFLAGILLQDSTAQQLIFEKTFGGPYQDGEGFNNVIVLNEGNYLLAGDYRYSNGLTDAYIVGIDTNGNEIASYKWGGSNYDMAYHVLKTADGNLLFAGRTWSYGAGWFDGWAYKFTPGGTQIWQKTYGGSGKEHFYRAAETPSDSGFVYTGGDNYSYFWIVKADKDGNQMWTKSMGLGSGTAVCAFPDRVIVVGLTGTYGPNPSTYNLYIVALANNGDTLYTRVWGGNQQDGAYGICSTTDNGYIVVGHTASSGAGGYDAILQKYSMDGTLVWAKQYGGAGDDALYDIKPTSDNCYLAAGYTNSFGAGGNDVYLLKIDQNGDTIWTATYGGALGDVGYSIAELVNGCYLISGQTYSSGAGSSDHYLLKLRDNGIVPVELTAFNASVNITSVYLEWTTGSELNNAKFEVERKNNINDLWEKIATIKGAGTAASSNTYSFTDEGLTAGKYTYRLKQIDFDGSFEYSGEVSATIMVTPRSMVLYQNYPNPFNPSTVIEYYLPEAAKVNLLIFDALGNQKIAAVDTYQAAGKHSYEFNGKGLSSGLYFCKLTSGTDISIIKMIYLK